MTRVERNNHNGAEKQAKWILTKKRTNERIKLAQQQKREIEREAMEELIRKGEIPESKVK